MKFEFSAGGIVYKRDTKRTFILVSQHSGHHGWVFPKGHIADKKKNETKEEAALREVQEETGVVREIIQPLPPITYWFIHEKEKIKKTVYYFLMQYVQGKITDHDHEMEKVEWLPIEEVAERLTYPSDKQIWEKAKLAIDS